MIFGNASLLGLPWETIIKVYRDQLAEKRFDTAQEYAEDFLGFLAQDHGMFSQETRDEQTAFVIFGLLAEVRQIVEKERFAATREKGAPLSDDEVSKLVDKLVDYYLAWLRKQEFLTGFSAADFKGVEKRYGQLINTITKDIFDGLPVLPATHKKLRALAVEVLPRKVLGDSRSGLVVAGFGEKEFLPVLLHYRSKLPLWIVCDTKLSSPSRSPAVIGPR